MTPTTTSGGVPVQNQARFLRADALPGVEVLHATFVDFRYAPHTHAAHTIALVDRGAATFDLEGSRHVAPEGSVFVIPAGWAHTGESVEPTGYRYRVLYVDPETISETMQAQPNHQRLNGRRRKRLAVVRRRSTSAARLATLHRRFADIDSDLHASEEGFHALHAVIEDLVLENVIPQDREVDHVAVRRAATYLEEHWHEAVSLAELATHAGASPYRLSRMFHRELGLPPSAFQRQLRIEHAKRLLRGGAMPVEVALQCGFYDQAHLTRHFHRMTGVSPAAYARG
jgi:AraC-like DNA-binding protein